MRSAAKISIILILSVSLVLVFIIIDSQSKVTKRYKSEMDEASAKEALALKRALYIVNAPALLLKMDLPRKIFQFILEPNNIYFSEEDSTPVRWTSVVMVKSAHNNKDRRDAIRETWGSVKTFNGSRFVTIFILGRSIENSGESSAGLREEHEKFNDILLLNLPDTTDHLPDKTLAGMQWVADSLPSHWIYSSADDDMSLRVPNFAKYIDQVIHDNLWKDLNYEATLQHLPIMCIYSYQDRDVPARNPESKWYMPPSVYPPKKWPPHCRGGWYSMAVKTAGILYRVSRWLTYLHLDDVWITGLMRIRYLAESDLVDEHYLTNGILTAAPLATRSNQELIRNDHENSSSVIVSHAWGNIEKREVDVSQTLRKVWKTWLKLFPEK